MLAIDHVAIAGHRNEDVANRSSFANRHDAESVHHRLDRFDWIDFGDDNIGAHATSTHCDTLAAPTITHNDDRASREQDVRCANDAVERRLARAVAIVEEVFRLRVVNRDGREGQHTCRLHCLETLNAGGCFFS